MSNNIKSYVSKTKELQNELDEVKGLVMDNINQVMIRAKNLEEVALSAQQLNEDAGLFKQNAKDIER